MAASGVGIWEVGGAEDLAWGVGTLLVHAPGAGFMSIKRINLSSFGLYKVQTWDPGTIAAFAPGVYATVDVVVPGAVQGMGCLVFFDSPTFALQPTLQVEGRVSSLSQVTVVMRNFGGASISPGQGTLKIVVFPLPATS